MKMNIDLVNRALMKIGEEPLDDKEIDQKTARWRMAHKLYLDTILETLSNSEWTSCKKRCALELSDKENLTEYLFAYPLPPDCAKPERLQDDSEFIVEGSTLYTDQQDAILEYISNGYIQPERKTVMLEEIDQTMLPDGNTEHVYALPEDIIEELCLTSNEIYYISDGMLRTIDDAAELDYLSSSSWITGDDWPMYREQHYDPMLSEYIETRLACKFALKVTGKRDMYQMLYAEMQITERRAVAASSVHGSSRENGDMWWGDQLGLMSDGTRGGR